jgi:hypothetical protein
MAQPKETADPKMIQRMSMKEFLETQPLYTRVQPTSVLATNLIGFGVDVLFLHCMTCKDTRPFRYPRGGVTGHSTCKGDNDRIHRYHYICTGCEVQPFVCWVWVNPAPETWVQKLGQYPSVVDLHSANLKRYRTILAPEDYRELARAVGLATHGVGIGAFVYLRRIFERLIEEAHQTARQDSAWDEDHFLQSRIPEKIGLLAPHLPGFLVETKSLYGILSKGLHELSEDECLQYFSIIQNGIELILEERIATKEKNAKIEQTKKEIARLTQKIKEQSA